MDKIQGRKESEAAFPVLTHDYLRNKFLKAMGGKVPMMARQSWGRFLKTKATRFVFRYEWIVDSRFYVWVSCHKQLEMEDGVEWFGVLQISPS